MKYYSGLWKVKSKGAVLTLILHYLVVSVSFTIYHLCTEAHNPILCGKDIPSGVVGAVLAVCSPVAGWLADVHYGRYKVLRMSLCFMWIGSLCMTATILVGYGVGDCLMCGEILENIVQLLGIVLLATGLSAYSVNAVQFGIDQMPDASSDELSAYIHWFVWVIFAGEFTGRLVHHIRNCAPMDSIGDAIQIMVPNVMLSLALCCMFMLNGWFIKEPGSSNSLTTVLKVLKFAATHKYPVRRRAITYCEDERPSRIDFAKDKYGGPFTTEQVEDVKTVFRMAMVIAVAPIVGAPSGWFSLTWETILSHIFQGVCTLDSLKIFYYPSLFAVTIIPLYTFIIYPLVRKRVLKMLQRVVVAAAMMVILSGAVLTIGGIKHALDPDSDCMFSSSPNVHVLKPGAWMTIPINVSLAIEGVLYLTAIVEFTCAQSPYKMRGLLTGLLFSSVYFSMIINVGVSKAWENFPKEATPTCSFYYFLFQFVFAVIGLIVIGITARWYKRRQRQEEDDQRRIVEAIYDRMLCAQYQSSVNGMEED